jgi:hypothetical protein
MMGATATGKNERERDGTGADDAAEHVRESIETAPVDGVEVLGESRQALTGLLLGGPERIVGTYSSS